MYEKYSTKFVGYNVNFLLHWVYYGATNLKHLRLEYQIHLKFQIYRQ